jgi:hypothetical protein
MWEDTPMATDTAEQTATDVKLDLINESNDLNNSKVVIFGQSEAVETAPAMQTGAAIRLNFFNHSNDANNSEIVIFAKSGATDVEELAVAWTVIENCGQGWSHPFEYPMEVSVGASDSYGNYSPQMTAWNGQAFSVVRTTSGDAIHYTGPASSPNAVEIGNALMQGAVNTQVYRDGRLFAQKTSVAPGQKAAFSFKPTIWIGVASQVQQGQVMNSAIISQINTELSLLGIAQADIIMTGGGPGPSATPFVFTLGNVTYA